MGALRKTLWIALYARGEQEPLFCHEQLHKSNYAYRVHSLGTESTPAILARSVLMPERLSSYDFVVTSEYFASFGVNLRLLLTRARTKHVTIGLNQSRRLLKTGVGWIDGIVNAVFRRTDLVVVHSRREAELFARLHRIPRDRFLFSLWGFDLPEITASRFSQWPRRYVCLVGRNNRDVETFVAAVEGTDADGIVITSRLHAPAGKLPANVHVLCDLPVNETFDCIRNAAANAILLKDNARGAGHITAVAAMFAGVPQIVSDVDVIKDYLVDGFSAIAVPVGDVEAVRGAIARLLADPAYAARIGGNGKGYALRWLTNARVSERVVDALSKVASGEAIATVDPQWQADYDVICRSPTAS
jgi:glycosyltransferase involved in cell wall biosynthesis